MPGRSRNTQSTPLAAAVSPAPAAMAFASTPVSVGRANAAEIVGQRVVERTKGQYETTLKYITKYCSEHYPEAIDPEGNLILPMTQANLEGFLGDMAADRQDGSCKAFSTVTGYCTVLKFYYREAGVIISPELERFFKNFHEGYKRKIAQKKDKGFMKNFEGKVAVTYVIYTALAKVALFAALLRTRFASMVHLFLILCWNLFARSCSVADLRTHHFGWSNDALVIDMSKHKGDQTGESQRRN